MFQTRYCDKSINGTILLKEFQSNASISSRKFNDRKNIAIPDLIERSDGSQSNGCVIQKFDALVASKCAVHWRSFVFIVT